MSLETTGTPHIQGTRGVVVSPNIDTNLRSDTQEASHRPRFPSTHLVRLLPKRAYHFRLCDMSRERVLCGPTVACLASFSGFPLRGLMSIEEEEEEE